MRATLAFLLLLVPALAHADRATYATLGITGDARGTGDSFGTAGDASSKPFGGMRLGLSWEDAPLPIPPGALVLHDARLVPELNVGFLSNDRHAEGYLGAGLRGELHLASRRLRTAIYGAARADVIGKHRDGAGEFVIGEYILLGRGRTRFGWEGGAIVRPRPDVAPSRSHELDAILTVYVGWRL